jgi:hypothetical protein
MSQTKEWQEAASISRCFHGFEGALGVLRMLTNKTLYYKIFDLTEIDRHHVKLALVISDSMSSAFALIRALIFFLSKSMALILSSNKVSLLYSWYNKDADLKVPSQRHDNAMRSISCVVCSLFCRIKGAVRLMVVLSWSLYDANACNANRQVVP